MEDGGPQTSSLHILSSFVFASAGIALVVGTAADFAAGTTKFSFCCSEIVSCFSLKRNVASLMMTTKKTAVVPEREFFGFFNGMRVVSLAWILLYHTHIFLPPSSDLNYGHSPSLGRELILCGAIAVDTFFFMSGFLVAHGAFSQLESGRFSFALFYLRRWIRLTIPLAFVMLAFMSIGARPNSELETRASLCAERGWANLVYVNNLLSVPPWPCMGHTWFLAADMQLFAVLTPLVILPMHKWRTGWGMRIWCATFAIATAIPFAVSLIKRLPPIPIETLTSEEGYHKVFDFYMKPWAHAQPYLIGILVAQILRRNRFTRMRRIHWAVNLTLWLLSSALGLFVVLCLGGVRETNALLRPSYTPLGAALYNSLSKVGWSLFLSWVTVACARGRGGLVERLLSWGFFSPLARMSYVAYLVHQPLIYAEMSLYTHPVELSAFSQFLRFSGLLGMTFALAFAGCLVFEMPFVALERAVFSTAAAKPKNAKGSRILEEEEEAMTSV